MSYLEQSTRYIAYDARLGGRYRYYRDPDVLGVAARHPLRRRHGPAVRHLRRAACPGCRTSSGRSSRRSPSDSDFVYRQAIRAKAFDAAARHPAGRVAVQRRHLRHRPGATRQLLLRMRAHPLPEARALRRPDAARAAQGDPVVPQAGRPRRPGRGLEHLPGQHPRRPWRRWPRGSSPTTSRPTTSPAVTLVDFDPDAEVKLVTAMLYPYTHLPEAQVERAGAGDDRRRARWPWCGPTWATGPTAATSPGRALERLAYRFDVLADYGAFRDLQRHRMLTIEWQRAHARATATPAPRRSTSPAQRRAFDEAMERSAALYDALVERVPGPGALRRVAWPTGCASRCRSTPARRCTCSSCARRPQGHPAYRAGRPGDAPPHRRAGRPPRRGRDDALRRPHPEPELERLEAERRAEARRTAPADAGATTLTRRRARALGHGDVRVRAGGTSRPADGGRQSRWYVCVPSPRVDDPRGLVDERCPVTRRRPVPAPARRRDAASGRPLTAALAGADRSSTYVARRRHARRRSPARHGAPRPASPRPTPSTTRTTSGPADASSIPATVQAGATVGGRSHVVQRRRELLVDRPRARRLDAALAAANGLAIPTSVRATAGDRPAGPERRRRTPGSRAGCGQSARPGSACIPIVRPLGGRATASPPTCSRP